MVQYVKKREALNTSFPTFRAAYTEISSKASREEKNMDVSVSREHIRAVEIQACITLNLSSVHILDPIGPRWIGHGKEYFGDNPQDIFVMAQGRNLIVSFAMLWIPDIAQWYINLSRGSHGR